MNTGVSTFPCASSRVAARAAPSVAWIVNLIELASIDSRLITVAARLLMRPVSPDRARARRAYRDGRSFKALVPLFSPLLFVKSLGARQAAGIAHDDTGSFHRVGELIARLSGHDAHLPATQLDLHRHALLDDVVYYPIQVGPELGRGNGHWESAM